MNGAVMYDDDWTDHDAFEAECIAMEEYWDPIFDERNRVRDFSQRIANDLPAQVDRIKAAKGASSFAIKAPVRTQDMPRSRYRRRMVNYTQMRMWSLKQGGPYVTDTGLIVGRSEYDDLAPLDLTTLGSSALADLYYSLCTLGTKSRERRKVRRLEEMSTTR